MNFFVASSLYSIAATAVNLVRYSSITNVGSNLSLMGASFSLPLTSHPLPLVPAVASSSPAVRVSTAAASRRRESIAEEVFSEEDERSTSQTITDHVGYYTTSANDATDPKTMDVPIQFNIIVVLYCLGKISLRKYWGFTEMKPT